MCKPNFFHEKFEIVALIAVSGEVAENPCISHVSGCIFERRLLDKYVQEHGTDPTNNEPITPDQITDIKVCTILEYQYLKYVIMLLAEVNRDARYKLLILEGEIGWGKLRCL